MDDLFPLTERLRYLNLRRTPPGSDVWSPRRWVDYHMDWQRGTEDPMRTLARFLVTITGRQDLTITKLHLFHPSSRAMGAIMLARFLCGVGRTPFGEDEAGLEVMKLIDIELFRYDLWDTNEWEFFLVELATMAFYSQRHRQVLGEIPATLDLYEKIPLAKDVKRRPPMFLDVSVKDTGSPVIDY